ncbi:MAG: HEAT repeat domain-containing protein [Candidatus Marinimicrobia bacterium]|nr:HEAT repeat domain-containing protein [Candidatus Neomarinimicrobiota bacterium]
MKRKILLINIILLCLIIIACGGAKKNYEKVKQVNTIQSYEAFIQQYSKSNYVNEAKEKLDSLYFIGLRSNDLKQRLLYIRLLYPKGKDAVSILLKALKDTNANCRWSAAGALALIGQSAKEALPLLQSVMYEDSDQAVIDISQLAVSLISNNSLIHPPKYVRLTTSSKPGDLVIKAPYEKVLIFLAGGKCDVRDLILSIE